MCKGKVLVILTLRLGGHTEAEKKSLPYLCPERVGVWQRDVGNEDSGYEKTRRTETTMIRFMCGVRLSDRKASAELLSRLDMRVFQMLLDVVD